MMEKTAVRPAADLSAQAMPPGTGRAVLIGTAIGFVVVGGFFGAVSFAFGVTPAAALALALFTGGIGGPGFGGMMGFVLNEARSNENKV